MAEDASDLIPTAEKAVFLLTVPPKSLFHDQHRVVQLQRVVHQSDTAGSRIKPIFNLEYHKIMATRVIELEDDDSKVAEFHPTKGHHGHREDAEVVTTQPGSIRRRKRTFSIEGKSGSLGGHITSQARNLGLCDMTVSGSERLGQFDFHCPNGSAYEWRKASVDNELQWRLENDINGANIPDRASKGTNVAPDVTNRDKDRTSYEFLRLPEPRPLNRVNTSHTLTSQYTTHFENESQLSGLTSTPQVDPRDVVPGKSLPEAQTLPRAVLAFQPVPHLKIYLNKDTEIRHSMHQISSENEEIYRILLSTLWIIWSSPEFSIESEAQQQMTSNGHDSPPGEGMTLIDRHSKIGLSKNTSEHSVERRRKSSTPGVLPTAPPLAKKKAGLFGMISKICGG